MRSRFAPVLACAGFACIALTTSAAQAQSAGYNVVVVDQVWRDEARLRDVPVRLRLPQPRRTDERLPVIVYSHGLGGGLDSGRRWVEHWSANGYIVINVEHPGSDGSLWNMVTSRVEALKNLRQAATANELIDRAFDLRFVLDEIATRVEFRNADLQRIGVAGHSFGAMTAQAIAGQKFRARGPEVADPRVRAAIALSPTVRNRVDAETQFQSVSMPFMSITGTRDGETFGFGVPPEERTRPFYAMPAGGKYLVVFQGADHVVFSGVDPVDRPEVPRPPDAAKADPHVQRATAALTLAFWDAYLKGLPQARAWLATQARRVLVIQDRFERR